MEWSSSQTLQDESLMNELFSIASNLQFNTLGFDTDGESEDEEQKEQEVEEEVTGTGTELYCEMFTAPSTSCIKYIWSDLSVSETEGSSTEFTLE